MNWEIEYKRTEDKNDTSIARKLSALGLRVRREEHDGQPNKLGAYSGALTLEGLIKAAYTLTDRYCGDEYGFQLNLDDSSRLESAIRDINYDVRKMLREGIVFTSNPNSGLHAISTGLPIKPDELEKDIHPESPLGRFFDNEKEYFFRSEFSPFTLPRGVALRSKESISRKGNAVTYTIVKPGAINFVKRRDPGKLRFSFPSIERKQEGYFVRHFAKYLKNQYTMFDVEGNETEDPLNVSTFGVSKFRISYSTVLKAILSDIANENGFAEDLKENPLPTVVS